MPTKRYDRCCTSCGAEGVGVIETRFVDVKPGNGQDSRRLCYGLPVKSYIRRRRQCASCGHRFGTVEVSLEDIEATSLELENLRDQVAKYKSAMELLLDCKRP